MVSRLGFGAMRLPVTQPDGTISFGESTRIIRRALELGINFYDTHHMYLDGQSEAALGKALAGLPRESYLIQSKVADWKDETDDDTFPDRLRRGLDALGCGYYDFYLMHSITWERFEKNGARFFEVAEQARREGLVRHIGFSSHDDVPNVIKLVETGRFECMLVQYNFLDSRYGEALAAAHEAGLGTGVMGPLGGGRFIAPSAFSEAARAAGSPVEAALRFAFANDDVDVVLSGMTRMSDVEENARIACATTPLNEDDVRRIRKEAAKRRKLADLYCTGCGYCTPCPAGVNIPRVFELRNYHEVFGLRDYARKGYARLVERDAGATSCTECGACEEKCPQKLAIRHQLKQCHRLLGGEGSA